MPKTRQAKAVNSKAGQIIPPDPDKISDVILIPNPVIPRTPMIMEAHMIIDAIVLICWPAFKNVLFRRSIIWIKLNVKVPSNISKITAANIAIDAAYWGVNPRPNIAQSKRKKGTKKNPEVINTSRKSGNWFLDNPFKS